MCWRGARRVMTKTAILDATLQCFRKTVAEAYGNRLARVVLFGSRARGDARSDSDYDVAVFLHGLGDRVQAMMELADIGTDILYQSGGLIHAVPYRAEAYNERTALMQQIRRDGVEL